MKIAVLSDIHGNAVALESVLNDAIARGMRHAFVLGDLFLKGPEPDRVLDLLSSFHILSWVRGNTDESLAETPRGYVAQNELETRLMFYHHYCWDHLTRRTLDFVGGMDEKAAFTLGTARICCLHGSPASLRKGLDGDTPVSELECALQSVGEDIILCGHTHKPFEWWKKEGGRVRGIVNSGSIGMPADGDPDACYAVLELSPEGVKLSHRRVPYSIDQLRNVALERGFPDAEKYCESLAAGRPF